MRYCLHIPREKWLPEHHPPIAQLVEHATVDVKTPNRIWLDDGYRGVMGSTPIGRTFCFFGGRGGGSMSASLLALLYHAISWQIALQEEKALLHKLEGRS